jgi:hypothetical protein
MAMVSSIRGFLPMKLRAVSRSSLFDLLPHASLYHLDRTGGGQLVLICCRFGCHAMRGCPSSGARSTGTFEGGTGAS